MTGISRSLIRPPTLWPVLDTELISNFDHILNQQVRSRVTAGGCVAMHPAWNFFGVIWCADGRWFEMVKSYRVHVVTVEAPSLEAQLEAVNNEFGWQ